MKLTTTEKYALAVLKTRGKLSSLQKGECGVCLAASCIWDLMETKTVETDKKGKLKITAPLPGTLIYCAPIYEMLEKKPMKPTKAVLKYMAALTDKRIRLLVKGMANDLIRKSALAVEQRGRLLKSTLCHVDTAAIADDLAVLKHMDESITPEQFMLAILLLKSGTAKKLLNKAELSNLKKAAKQDNGDFQPYVKKMVSAVESVKSACIVAAIIHP